MLKRLLVINWHFLDKPDIIDLGARATHIVGPTASGKTTIVDALQTVLFFETNDYNKANEVAGRRGGRNIMTYVRGFDKDTGKNKRPGSTCTYLAVEIYDGNTNDYMVCGFYAGIYNASENPADLDRCWWYKKCRLDSLHFTKNEDGHEVYLSYKEFKKANNISEEFRTIKAGKLFYSHLFRLTQKVIGDVTAYDSWIKRQKDAIAYNPKTMCNMEQFLKELIFTPDPLDGIETFNSLVESQESLSLQMKSFMNERASLAGIMDQYAKYNEKYRKYEIARIGALIASRDAEKMKMDKAENDCLEEQKNLDEVDRQMHEANTKIANCKSERQAIASVHGEELLLKDIETTEQEYETAKKSEEKLRNTVQKLLSLKQETDNIETVLPLNVEAFNADFATDTVDYTEAMKHAIDARASIRKAKDVINEAEMKIMQDEDASTHLVAELKEDKNSLSGGFYRESPSSKKLSDAIKEAFADNNISDEPQPLYKLLNIKDDSWQSAIETFLSGARFDFVVRPENFLVASNALKRLTTKDSSVYGVGILNLDNLKETEVEDGTLPSVLTSENVWVRRYIADRYKNVYLSENADKDGSDAAKRGEFHKIFIDKYGRKYARRNFNKNKIASVNCIGEQAREAELQRVEEDLRDAIEKQTFYRAEHSHIRKVRMILDSQEVNGFLANGDELMKAAATQENLKNTILQKKSALSNLHNSDAVRRLKTLDEEIKLQQGELERLLVKKNEISAKIGNFIALKDNANIAYAKVDAKVDEARYENYFEEAEASYNKGRKNYQPSYLASTLRKASVGAETPEDNGLKGECTAIDSEIMTLERLYNKDFAAYYDAQGVSTISSYEKRYAVVNNDLIPDIHVKIEDSVEQAKNILRLNIIAGLSQNINNARKTITDINRILATYTFANNTRYSLRPLCAAKGRQEEYDALLNFMKINEQLSMNFDDTDTLSLSREDATKDMLRNEVIERLCDEITATVRKAGADTELLDYRTYCSFDLRIESSDADNTNNSEEEVRRTSIANNSGGEVQIPFYILLSCALFLQYKRGEKRSQRLSDRSPVRMICIDEAFDKLDSANTRQMLSYMVNQMGLQVIASSPASKFEGMRDFVDSVLLMATDQKTMNRDVYTMTNKEFEENLDQQLALEEEDENAESD